MGKKEDEIQKKLVELEISIKDEEAKRQVPAAKRNSTELTTTDDLDAELQKQAQEVDVSLYQLGGYGLVIASVCMLLAHMQPVLIWNFFSGSPAMGLLLIPLFVGIGWLFYDFKSKAAQFMSVGTLAALFFVLLSNMTIRPIFNNMLDLVMMAVPLCLGGALLMKAQVKRQQGVKELKDSQHKK
jgi:hypothetical protein